MSKEKNGLQNIREKYKFEGTDENGTKYPIFGARENKSLVVDYNPSELPLIKSPLNFLALMDDSISKRFLSAYKEDIIKASKFHSEPSINMNKYFAYFHLDDNGVLSLQTNEHDEPIFRTLVDNISAGFRSICEFKINEHRRKSDFNPCLSLLKSEPIFLFDYEIRSSDSKMIIIVPHYLVEIYESKFGGTQLIGQDRLLTNPKPLHPSIKLDVQYGNIDLDQRLIGELKTGDVLIIDSLPGDLFKILLDDKAIALGVPVVADNSMGIRIVKML
ncbi:MAG: FliM/FliN family flagellar motor switch protein [Bdellovibrionales bacterium]|nr:FliM/FliN family flagellar motor switch protein [Bdellovibrionales bacterium]